jgi:hypothetical protein
MALLLLVPARENKNAPAQAHGAKLNRATLYTPALAVTFVNP